jgi:hypothetical protein
MYYIILAGYKFADNSISDKKQERFQSVINEFQKFEALYPQSTKLPELKKINEICSEKVK